VADYDPFAAVRTPSAALSSSPTPPAPLYPCRGLVPGHAASPVALDPATKDAYEFIPGVPPSTQDAVRDADPLGEPSPPVFSHGFAGHRRQTTHLCTHLASHGYAVAAPDHVGNTTIDVRGHGLGRLLRTWPTTPRASAQDRPVDAPRTLDALPSGELGVAATPDGRASPATAFWGWTTLTTTARPAHRGRSLAPAGGRGTRAGPDRAINEPRARLAATSPP
jgi:hypothetical protein